jgi:hypothetical protein
MANLELQRSPDDRRLYTLGEIGTLRLGGFFSSSAVAEANGTSWRIARRGFWQRRLEATDAAGSTAGSFETSLLRRGGILHWGNRELQLVPASNWRERYALLDGEDELAFFDAKSWGKRPVKVDVDDEASADPGLLLFATFVVRGLANDRADTAAGAGASTAAIGGG